MQDFFHGAISGVVQTIVGFPFDTLKIRIQNNEKNIFNKSLFSGISYPMRSSVANCAITFGVSSKLNSQGIDEFCSGFISGACIVPIVYVSDTYKIQRQLHANTANFYKIPWSDLMYRRGKFSTFLRESFAFAIYFKSYSVVNEYLNNSFISGGIAGLLNWTATYPLDVIRNREIAQNIKFRDAYKMGNLWKGYSFCAIRAVKVNAVGFYVYEQARTFTY